MSIAVHSADRGRRSTDGLVLRVFDLLMTWQERGRQRRHLSALPEYLLSDMGLSRADVEGETSKPVWRA